MNLFDRGGIEAMGDNRVIGRNTVTFLGHFSLLAVFAGHAVVKRYSFLVAIMAFQEATDLHGALTTDR